MRRFLLLLLILLSAFTSDLYAQVEGRLTAPKKVCKDAYASMHAFLSDKRAVDSVQWTIDPPIGATYTHSRTSPVNPLFKYMSPPHGQSVTLIVNEIGVYNITATIYYTSSGTVRTRTRTQSFEVFDCSMNKCEGTFTPSTNFKETFGQFYAGAPRRSLLPPDSINYTFEDTDPLQDDFYSIHYNSRIGGRPEWDNVGDHTNNGFGGMLIANSSNNPKLFYRRRINDLCPGAKYNFSAWFINLNSLNVLNNVCQQEDYRYAGVTFIVRNASNEAIIRTFNTNDVSMDLSRNLAGASPLTGWQQFGGTLTLAPGQEDVIVEIVNNNPGGCGNDIAVDDIEFVFCAPKIYSYIDGLGEISEQVCPGAELTLTSVIEPSNYFTNPIYRWEMNRNGTGWVNVTAPGYSGMNTPILTIMTGTLQELDMILYRLMVIESGNVGESLCYTPSNMVTLDVLKLPQILATRPTICRGDTTILMASPLETPSTFGYQTFTFNGPNILTWPTSPAPKDSIIVNPVVTSVYNVTGSIKYGRYQNGTQRVCTKDANITINVDQPPVVNLGPDQILCAGTPVTLDAGAANTPFQISWAPGGQTSQTINITAPTPGAGIPTLTNQYRVMVTNGECTVRDTVNITGVATAVANINMPAFYCGTPSISLKADAVTADYSGMWTIVGTTYGASILNPTLATGAQLTNVPLDQQITVRWTVSAIAKPECSSFEELVILSETRPTATVTGPFDLCSPVFPLSGNVPGVGMTGQWVVINGTATFDDATSPTATATVTGGPQTVTVEWRVSRTNPSSVCAVATRQTTLNYTAPPLLNVTSPVLSCSNTLRFVLPWAQVNDPESYVVEAYGANPMPGFNTRSGSISGPSGLLNIPIPANTPAGTYTFRITAVKTSPDNCNGYTNFTVRIETPSSTPTITVSAARICIGGSVTLTANGTLGSSAQWTWYRGACGVTTAIGTGPSIVVSPTANTTYTVRGENPAPCANGACASTSIVVDAMPSAANAGPDQERCNNATFNLNATAPTVGIGTWTVPAGVTLTGGINNRNAIATVPAGTTATLTWTVTNGTCTSTPDQVVLINRNPITNNVIELNQVICYGTTPNAITNIGTPAGGTGIYDYQWESSTTSASSGFTAIGGATGVTFQPGALTQTTWYRRVITSGLCTSVSNVVEIKVNLLPVIIAENTLDACNASGKFEVKYTISQGTPVRYDLEAIGPNPLPTFVNISNAVLPSSPLTIDYPPTTPAGTYNFRMVVRDAIGCLGETTFTVTLESLSTPAWIDITPSRICIGQSVTLTARGGNLGSNAEWVWYLDSCGNGTPIGTGVTLTYTPTATTTFAVRAESNRACKNSDCATETITVDQMPDAPNAGSNQEHCNDAVFVMNANVPNIGTGAWTIPAGVTISDINDPKATVNVPVGQSVTLYWTITNGTCVTPPASVILTNLNPITNNVIAQNQVICSGTQPAQLTGVGAPSGGNGNYSYQWESSTTSATAGFTPVPSAIGSIFQPPVLTQTTWYRRIITSGACSAPSNAVQIRIASDPPVVVSTPPAVNAECVAGTDYRTLFGVPVFSHPDNFTFTVTHNDVTTPLACGFTITRTWTATDACMHTVSTSQTITVVDTRNPVITGVPAAAVYNCDQTIPLQPDLTVTDDCSAVTVTKSVTRANGSCANNYILTRIWTARDACGNETIATQTITVQDTTKPTFTTHPKDTTVNCDAVPVQVNLAATDNCGTVNVTMAETRANGSCANNYILTRTWSTSDACGNDSIFTQIITVRDTTKPTFTTHPKDTTVNCDAVPVQVNLAATDNCGGTINVVMAETRANGSCANNYILTRTWTASDICGNDSIFTQIITVRDTTKPTFTTHPKDTTVNCDAVPVQVNLAATDNCGGTINVVMAETRANGSCANNYILTRTWTASDVCGNDSIFTQIITVRDTTKPTFTTHPKDTTVNCDAVPVQVNLTATDNCGTVNVTMNETRANGSCANNYILTRTWTASDLCGNDSIFTQIITVRDTTKPTFTTHPKDTTVNCDAVPVQVNLTATDNCGGTINVVMAESRANGSCANNYILTRTWTASDICGNDSIFTQIITVRDTTKPTFTTHPADTTVNCDAVPVQVNLTATDNCGGTINVVMAETRANGSCANNYILTRTWTASDICGNDSIFTQIITVRDTTKPTFTTHPKDTTVNCDAVPVQVNLAATDNCGGIINVVMAETRANGSCANNYILTRTWTASDICGNDSIFTQIITVRDTTKPTFSTHPADTTVNCDAVPVQVNLTATDNCGTVNVTMNETRANGSCANNYILTRTWTASDICGNDSIFTQIITVRDTTKPTFTTHPKDTTVNCDAVPVQVNLAATDNCGGTINVVMAETRANGNCANNYILTRTWTASDICGNDSIFTQIITVRDTTKPTFSTHPADTTVNCNAVPVQVNLAATDNCGGTINVVMAETRANGSCANNYILTRTWTASDICGNDSIFTQIITVRDTTKPTFTTHPADTTVNCDDVPVQVNLTATDNCGGTINVVMAETRANGSCANNYILTRTWTASDICGNDSIFTQIITVRDTTKPTFSTHPADTTVNCDAVPVQVNLTATDNCGTVNVTMNETRANGTCANNYILTRTWTASDICGNDSIFTQIITVRDTTKPTFTTHPADTTVNCDAVPVQVNLVATDNCGGIINVVMAETRANGNCANNYILTRTWTASDVCGNDSIFTQIITVRDTTKPTFTTHPADTTVNCDAVPVQVNLVATDNCGTVNVTMNETRANGSCANNYILTRTWTTSDVCGNDSIFTQIITVRDTTKPTFTTHPKDTTVNCDAVPVQVNLAATDNCGGTINVVMAEFRANGNCANNYILTRTWTASDICGNDSIFTQIITVRDTTKPTFTTHPKDTTVNCDAVPVQVNLAATDNCGGTINVVMAETRANGSCANNYILTRTWTASDICGNDSIFTQIITVRDTTKPTFTTHPADTTVNCDAVPVQVNLAATDNCGGTINVVMAETRANGSCANNYILTRTWTASDICGNDSIFTQIITVRDTTKPTFSTHPADTTVNCDAVPVQVNLVATDNCGTVNVTMNETRANGSCANNYILTRTWTASDLCGNDSIFTQIITVRDTTKPTFSTHPADTTVNCDAVPVQVNLAATDNCGTVNVTMNETRANGSCTNNYILTRTWTASDVCGNDSIFTQIITVRDTTKPTFTTHPADTTVNCDAVPVQVNLTATDNCGTVNVTMNETRANGSCANNYILTRTWTTSDVCGNDSIFTQIITVRDTTKPTFTTHPKDTTVNCDAVPVQVNLAATDNCGTVNVTMNETRANGSCANNYILTRTWTASDICGNDSIFTQIITVRDTTKPTFTTHPKDTTVNCDAVPVQVNLTATDNCGGTINVVMAETRANGSCANNYILTRTWTASDICGNDSIFTQIITVRDTTKPTFTTHPADTTVNCDDVPVQVNLTATDNCGGTINVVMAETRANGSCANNYILTRTWTASDICGNDSIFTQIITVRDTTKPTFSTHPADTTVNCDAVPVQVNLVATDNCGTVNVTMNETRANGSCANNYILTRTWTASDLCGNDSIFTQIITVRDTTKPTFTTHPKDTTVNCDAVPVQVNLVATDNCGTVNVTMNETRANGSCANNYILTRTWTASDVCGNDSIFTQIITVRDTTKPTFSTHPADTTVNCDAVPVQVNLAATDNCGTVNVTMNETRANGSCANNYILTRTWTASDICGNDSIYTQIITVQDTTKPTFTTHPANTTVNCDAVPVQVNLAATDNCGGTINVVMAETRANGSCANNYILTRTWTASDICGNDSIFTQIITVQDTTKPTFSTHPADTTVNCDAVPVQVNLAATDNCGTVNVTMNETRANGTCANNYILTRTWTASDICGNDSIFTQIITVRDTSKPRFTLPVPADTTVSCSAIPTQLDLAVTDNCSPTDKVIVLKNEIKQPIPGACANNYFLIRTWTALDECRNSVTVTQTITVVDTTRPTFTSAIPANQTVECNAIPTAPLMTATDNCSATNLVTVNYVQTRVDQPGACVNNYQLVRTWTATDECGNSTVATQTITVQDTQAPTFTSATPADTTVECDMVPVQPDLTATDNCSSNLTVTKNEQRNNGTCANSYTLIRTWTVTDECGNTTTYTQNVSVVDRTKPTFILPIPVDTIVNCHSIPLPAVLTATDKCSPTVSIVFNEQHIDIPGACANNYKLLRTWTATDACGNYSTVMQVVTVVDTTRPVFTSAIPANVTVDCNALPSVPVMTATDNCSAANMVNMNYVQTRVDQPGACVNNYQLVRTWTATDECGNRATAIQVITVQDTTKPVFNMPTPANATVECNNIPAQPVLTATDICSTTGVTVVRSERTEQIPGALCAGNYRLIRTWTATDECGNSTTVEQILTVVDNTAPGFTMPVPPDATVNCDNIPTQPNLTATDNCTPTNRITVVKDQRREDIPGACVNNYRLIRTWTATDECGNARTVQQVITVQDTTRPTFTVSIPADATVECSAIPVQPNLSVSDNCTPSNMVTVVKNERREDIPGACVNNYRLIRTWTATDECGNTRTVQQILTVTDRTAPAFTISTPADATVECNAIPVQPNLAAMDNCSPASAVAVTKAERRENIPGACVNNYRLIRTWTATDECGNSRTVQQVITVVDNTKPVFSTTPPADITVECSAIPAQPDLMATDNCSAMNTITIVKNEVKEAIPGACANNYRLIRTWTATDECGNSSTVKQVVTVQDKTAPVFSIVPPSNMTVNCHEVPAAPVVTATDNCSVNNVSVVYTFTKTQLSRTCVYNYRLDRVWTATDECGNKAIVTQVITVIDTTRPVFNAPTPRDTTVSCESIPNPQIVTASDNCSRPGGVTITHKQTRVDIPGACKNYRLINTWTAKDECGNTSVITQVVTVVDTTRPVIAPAPADITIMCGAPVPTNMIELKATDNCDGTFPKNVKYTIDPYVKDLCNGYTIIRRWKVSDACGNAAQDVIQRIIVRPCPKPELEADVAVNCSTNPFITLKTRGNVNKPVYVLVGVTPANAVQVPLISTNNRFNLNGATTASFIVRDGVTGCASDTMTYNITYRQMPVVNLGSDTSLCGGNGMVLDAGPANFGYQIKWSTGETTQRIRVVNAGVYKVTVSNGMCVATDSIKVSVIPMPLVNLPDTTICRGQNVKLDASVNGASYLWSTGATTPTINVSTQERFWVKVTKNGCITIDTIAVTVNPPPDITLSRDTTICPGQTVMLTVTTNAGRIQWGNGELGNSILVSRAGNYSVSVYRDNCVVKEFVKVSERPDMKFDLGPDRIMCPGGSILIDARNPDAASYRWNDGDLNPVKSITQAGKYIIGVLDRYCDRYKQDSINVVIAGPPTVNLGNDTIICKGRRHLLKANAKNATSYLWSTGATTSAIEVMNPGTYSVTAFNDCGSTTDEITIDVKECDSRPDFPNVFSPNGDGNNDVFRPVIRGPMYNYELRIFNRWGELVYISKDMHQGWNGYYKGRPVDVGTFVWWLSYRKATNGPGFVIKGDVTVLR